nr:uncharacterized protein LOC117689409 isoform X1 [Crassostrea gigas]
MAERRDDRSYTYDPVYRHLLRARELSQLNDVPQDLKAEINRAVELLQTIFEKDLLASEGTIIVDNVLRGGDPYSGEKYASDSDAIVEFNDMVLRDKNVHKVMIPVRDGVYLIRRMMDTEKA